MAVNRVKISAPGKIILSGEHAVVYGYPEILAAIDRRLTVEIERGKTGLSVFPPEGKPFVEYALEIVKTRLESRLDNLSVVVSSEIPIGCGLGSSAAFAVAITGAVFAYLKLPRSLKRINEIAYEIEKKQHGTPSGGDNTICTFGGFLLYRKEIETFKVFSSLKTRVFPKIFLINSGKPEESTGEMVGLVKNFVLQSPQKAKIIFGEMEKTTRNFLRYLSGEKQDFGDLIKENERLLEQLGVVSNKTKALIRKIESFGGSAKISGAGGVKGNSGMVLAYHTEPRILADFVRQEKPEILGVKLGERGVRNEKI